MFRNCNSFVYACLIIIQMSTSVQQTTVVVALMPRVITLSVPTSANVNLATKEMASNVKVNPPVSACLYYASVGI